MYCQYMFASLCILAYKRPEWLRECLDSILHTIDYPCEIIVNCDGGDRECYSVAREYFENNKISKLVLSNGKNRGVGTAFQNCLGVCEGDYIFKIDTDLIFREGWLSSAVSILENHLGVGAVSLFNYRNYDPNDTRFEITKKEHDVLFVTDFVSSVYGFRKESLPLIVPVQDDGNHTKMGLLGITSVDLVHNRGFGVGKSVYLSGTMEKPYKTPTFQSPLLFP